MLRRAMFLSLLLVMGLALAAVAADRSFQVTNVSADHVYLNGGSRDSLKVGDVLLKVEGSHKTPFLRVVYTARHSASCVLLDSTYTVAVGEAFLLDEIRRSGELIIGPLLTKPADSARTTAQSDAASSDATPAQLSGSLRFGFYTWQDNGPNNLNFSQSTARLNMRAEHLWQRDLALVVRTRGRYDARQRRLAGSVDRHEWRNRLWESSLSWRNEDRTRMIAVGRLLPRRIAGSGALDGALAEINLNGAFRVGALAGVQADQLYYDYDRPTVSRVGGYVSYLASTARAGRVDQTAGLIYERSEGLVNRTYISLAGTLAGPLWSVSHSAEVDLNTGWRKDATGQSVSLSNLYLAGSYRVDRRTRLSLSYDNRKNYLTWVNRTIVDSLFDENLRQGARLRADFTVTKTQLTVGAGYRESGTSEDRVWSYRLGGRSLVRGAGAVTVSAYWAGFDGRRDKGANVELILSGMLRSLGSLELALGQYRYSVDEINVSSVNNSVGLSHRCTIAQLLTAYTAIRYDNGDDIDGVSLRFELGYSY